jgi:hypothetical protein
MDMVMEKETNQVKVLDPKPEAGKETVKWKKNLQIYV